MCNIKIFILPLLDRKGKNFLTKYRIIEHLNIVNLIVKVEFSTAHASMSFVSENFSFLSGVALDIAKFSSGRKIGSENWQHVSTVSIED